MILFTRTFLPLFFLLLSLLSSCNSQQIEEGPTELRIYFDYPPATYAGAGASEVKRIDLFAFDAQGIFRGVWTDNDPVLNKEYCMTITDLPQNRSYRFIAWTGLDTDYFTTPATFVKDQTTFEEVGLFLEHQSGTVDTPITPLFHGEKSYAVTNSADRRVDIPLTQVSNTIRLTTESLANNSKAYRMAIYDNNGHYAFDCSFASDSDFSYTTLCAKDEQGQLSARLDVLKLASNRSPIIEITEQDGTVLFSKNLVTLINAWESDSYAYTQSYDMHIDFELPISIYINGWRIIEDDYALGPR